MRTHRCYDARSIADHASGVIRRQMKGCAFDYQK
jgi:hypothetical protein